MGHRWSIAGRVAVFAAAVGIVLGAGGSAIQAKQATGTHAAPHGTVTFAEFVGSGPTWILPIYTGAVEEFSEQAWFEYLFWRPLYWAGYQGTTAYNPQVSIAYAPRWSQEGRDTVATIKLRPYHWSDGAPVTTRDVTFWENLIVANKSQWAAYVPGEYPDNVRQLRVLSPTTFQVVFNGTYNHNFLEFDELSQITPLPQQAWDRASATGPVGNLDQTTAGAKAVYTFLDKQASDLATYATNPLWKTVDGPWQISAYSPTTNYAAMTANRLYSGANKPHFARLVEEPFTSDTAEFNALESGQLDYGYVPYNDVAAIPSVKAKGYQIAPWPQETWNGILPQYARNDPMAPVLDQLYIRQVLLHLINIRAITQRLWHGYAYYVSGPVPDPGYRSSLVTSYERRDPYPYSLVAATSLLRAHGWTVHPGGTTTCIRPGTGANECGARIATGTKLSFTMLAVAGNVTLQAIEATVQSAWAQAGIQLAIRQEAATAADTDAASCIQRSHCSWDFFLGREFWPFGAPGFYPTGQEAFGCGSYSNYQNWCNPATERVIQASLTAPGVSSLFAYENLMARLQVVLWLPMQDYAVSAIRRGIQGAVPQDPYLGIYPEQWASKS